MKRAVGFGSPDPRLSDPMEGLRVIPHTLAITYYLTG